MALTDAQIERYSRQIVLPQIGGSGQERLLRSAVAIAGDGTVAEIAALYLVGAGIGSVALHTDSDAVRNDLIALNPDVIVTLAPGRLASVSADLLIACNADLEDIDSAAASRRPLVAGGADGDRGWLVVSDGVHPCASCAARYGLRDRAPAFARDGSGGHAAPRLTPAPKQPQADSRGVIGSVIALAALKIVLGLGGAARGWWHFHGRESMLTEQALERFHDCPICAAA